MDTTPSLAILYPHLSQKELAQAEDNIERYLELVLRIFERMELQANTQPDQLTLGIGTL